MYRNKRECLHKKRIELPQGWLGTTTWPPSHCFATPIWLPYVVMCIGSMSSVPCSGVACFLIVKNHYYLTVRFTKLLTNGFRSSFEIPEVRNYIVNLEMKL